VGKLNLKSKHRLLIDDCTVKENVERLMAVDVAELCFTSPPYSDQRDYTGASDLSPFTLAKCMLAPAKLFAINLGYQRKDGEVFCYWNDWIHSAQTQGLKLLSWNIWDRTHAASIGQHTAMFPIEHEWIFVFGRETKELNRTVENKYAGQEIAGSSNRQKDGSMSPSRVRVAHSHRPIGTIVRCDIHRGDSPHPAMYPAELPQKYIEACTKTDDVVYDPFLGSGSTLIACEKTDRRCFGSEIEPLYGDVILERFAKFSGKDSIRESDGVSWSSINQD
jgi:DNA modification methylase